MRVKFQADADLDGRVLRGLKRQRRKSTFAPRPTPNWQVLRIAAQSGRVLVSQDRHTMPGHFARYIASGDSPGVILLRASIPIVSAIEELILIWMASDRLVWIPL